MERTKGQDAKSKKLAEEEKLLETFARVARLKPYLKKVGCDLPFYDFIDSYKAEFSRTIIRAKAECPSIINISEVDDAEYAAPHWSQYGVEEADRIFFQVEDKFEDYVDDTKASPSNISGCIGYFRSPDGFRSVILIPRNPPCGFEHRELKYAFKLASLNHEIGHVKDAEARGHLDPTTRRFDVVEAEAFANCYALERLAERSLMYSYNMLYDALIEAIGKEGYIADVGRRVQELHPRRTIPDWKTFRKKAIKLYEREADKFTQALGDDV